LSADIETIVALGFGILYEYWLSTGVAAFYQSRKIEAGGIDLHHGFWRYNYYVLDVTYVLPRAML